MTIAERNREIMNRTAELNTLDRKNLVANFTAYWPGKNAKNVSKGRLVAAIVQAEIAPQEPLSFLAGPGVRGTENW